MFPLLILHKAITCETIKENCSDICNVIDWKSFNTIKSCIARLRNCKERPLLLAQNKTKSIRNKAAIGEHVHKFLDRFTFQFHQVVSNESVSAVVTHTRTRKWRARNGKKRNDLLDLVSKAGIRNTSKIIQKSPRTKLKILKYDFLLCNRLTEIKPYVWGNYRINWDPSLLNNLKMLARRIMFFGKT